MIARWYGHFLLSVLLIAGRPAAAEPPTAAAQPTNQQVFATAFYTAALNAEGRLASVVHQSPEQKDVTVLLVEKFDFAPNDVIGGEPVLTDLTRVGSNEVEAVYSATTRESKAKDAPQQVIPEAYRVHYTFGQTEISVRIKTKLKWQFRFDLGGAAQIAQTTKDLKEVVLPAREDFGRDTEWRFIYADGTQLLYRYTGPAQHFGYHGGVSKFRWSRSLCDPNAEYVLTFRVVPGARGEKVLSSPTFQATTAQTGHFFFDQEEKRFKLIFERENYQKLIDNQVKDTAIEYRVIDHRGTELTNGKLPVDFAKESEATPKGRIEKELVLPLTKRGYFEVWCRVVDQAKVLRPVWTERKFCVLEALKPVEQERAESVGDWKGDYRRNAFLGLGLLREQVSGNLYNPKTKKGVYHADTGEYDWSELDDQFKQARANREKWGVNNHFMISPPAWVDTPQKALAYYKSLVARFKDDNQYWETTNEPNIVYKPREYYELFLKPLKVAISEVDPQAKIIAPCTVGWDYSFIEEIYKLGGKNDFDAISVHPYQGIPYDQSFIPLVERLRALMAKYGDEKKEVWLTEAGFGWWDLSSQVVCARQMVRRLLIQDQFGIPKDHDSYYYTSAKGYHRFYVVDFDGSLFPQGAALRNHKVRLAGTTYDRPLSFRLRFVKGDIYKGQHKQVVVLWTFDNNRTIQIKSDAQKASLSDMWGNAGTIQPTNGVFHVNVSGEPTYLELPPDAQVSIADEPPIHNVAQLVMGAAAAASSESVPADMALDGVWDSGGWRDATPNEYPDWWEVTLPYPQAVNRVHLYTDGLLKDFDIKGLVADQWVTLARIRDGHEAIYDRTFQPVVAAKIRVEILAGYGAYSIIHECEVFAAEGGAELDLVNWADALNGGKATASSSWEVGTVRYTPDHAIDGVHTVNRWQDYIKTVWIDGTPGVFPDWLAVSFAGKKQIRSVLVFVNNFAVWRPAETGIADCDLEYWDGAQWVKAGTVTGNKKGVISFPLKTPVATEKIRIVVNASNDKLHSAIMEVQAWGPKDQPVVK